MSDAGHHDSRRGSVGSERTPTNADEDTLAKLDQCLRNLGGELEDALAAGIGRCGKYTLVEELGEGGYGEVHVAVQDPPASRRVAIKILKRGLDTRDILRRFALEQSALARIEHPNVATILDAGITDDGRPWFAMPLLEGDPIDVACDDGALRLVDRVLVLAAACDGVQAAHAQGIVHRDLKPSNIIVVTSDEGLPSPKVIDFGIAKAVDATDGVTRTIDLHRLGTPAYMGPEQLAPEQSAPERGSVEREKAEQPRADTRSDVFALGVILAELLAGCRPTTQATADAPPPRNLSRTLLEAAKSEPERMAALARARGGLTIESLARRLHGDLDAIVAKATAFRPDQRYQSADALAADLRRWVASEPITARSAGRVARMASFVRRHQVLVTIVSIAVLSITATTVAALLQASSAQRERARAELQARRSTEVVEALRDVLAGIDPAVARGRDRQLIVELLDATVERQQRDDAQTDAQKDAQVDAVAAAEIAAVLGDAYISVEAPAQALDIVNAALTRLQGAASNASEEIARDFKLARGRLYAVRGDALLRASVLRDAPVSATDLGNEAVASWQEALRAFDEVALPTDRAAIRCKVRLWGRELVWPEGMNHRALGAELAEAVEQLDDREQVKWSFYFRRAELNNFEDLLAEYPPVLERATTALGALHPLILSARARLLGFQCAAAVESCVEQKPGLPVYDQDQLRLIWRRAVMDGRALEADLTAVHGADHRLTLQTRLWTAAAAGYLHGPEAARPLFDALRGDVERVEGVGSVLGGQVEAAWMGAQHGPIAGRWW
jgi:serine/threonine protein kinase